MRLQRAAALMLLSAMLASCAAATDRLGSSSPAGEPDPTAPTQLDAMGPAPDAGTFMMLRGELPGIPTDNTSIMGTRARLVMASACVGAGTVKIAFRAAGERIVRSVVCRGEEFPTDFDLGAFDAGTIVKVLVKPVGTGGFYVRIQQAEA